jgi:SAM-dependent methyltransferase
MARTNRSPRLAQAATWYSQRNRRAKARRLVQLVADKGVRTVLLVGTEDVTYTWSNIIEQALLGTDATVVASGLGPTIDVDAPAVICDGRALPFFDDAFDLVVSNAVLEHVGAEPDQRRFIQEHHRVGSAFVLTTPNRWFPVESHRRVLFRHWSARWRGRQQDQFSRLLSRRELRALLPAATSVRGRAWSSTFVATHSCGALCTKAR